MDRPANFTKGQKFKKGVKIKDGNCSPMSNTVWCDINSNGKFLKLHDKNPDSKCICLKQVTFTPNQVPLAGCGYKKKLQKLFKGTKKSMGFVS